MATSIPKTMKAAVVVKHKAPLEIKDVEVPEPTEGQVLIKVMMSGVCHTDVHVADGDWDCPKPLPMIPGHEGCGEVVKVGPSVKHVKVGDRVGVPWLHTACGQCFDCRDGWETVCAKQKQTGFSVNGGFAEYVVADANFVGHIPANLSYEQAAPILCAGVTVYKALKETNVKPGQFVVITGAAGGLGHVACQYAKAMGMRVIATSRQATPEKEKLLKSFGVEFIVDLSKETLDQGVKRFTDGMGAHGAVTLAPSNEDLTNAVHYLRPRGTVVPVAIPSGTFSASILMTILKAIHIVGSIVGTRNDLEEAFQFAADGKVKCVIHVRKFSEVNDIIEDLRQGKILGRVVMDMKL